METTKVEVKCDRCGKAEICDINPDTHAAIRVGISARVSSKLVGSSGVTSERSRDLCVDCTRDFERFMKGERLESGWVDPESLRPR